MSPAVHPTDGPVRDDGVLRLPARLQALADMAVLDTPDEELFDRWARLALDATGAQVALLSLVDDRRSFFKAFQVRGGGAGAPADRVVPIEASLCRETVVRGEDLVVEDAPADPRSAPYAAVRAFPVGAYAGVPVRGAGGEVVGSFCVVAPEPRSWAAHEVATLRALGAAAEAELRHRAARGAADRANALLVLQREAHELLMDGAKLPALLDALIRGVQRHAPGVRGNVLLRERSTDRLRHVAGPDMPPPFAGLVDGLPVGAGACGAAAATGLPVLVEDLAADPRTAGWAPTAHALGLRAVWSMPVRGTGAGEVLGTFAFYADRERLPTQAELDLLEGAARLATIAVELDRTRRDLVDLAESDPLTGLPNRASLSRRLQARLDIARHDEPVAVLFCDLDRFKLVNDSLGHAAGDMVLVDVARRLRDATRPGDLVARLGGDEFVVVPAGPVDEAAAHRLAARVRDALGAPAPAGAPPHLVGASIGIAVAAGGSASEVLRRADSAMYVAKVGRHDVAVHDVAVDARRSDELRLRDALAGALDRGELRLVYQPVLDLPTGRVRGFEALVRWRHPELGDVPPARFVPLAEEHGLIRTIGAWVLDTALHDAAGWPEVGGAPLSVSVNLSCEQLGEPELADAVLAATAQAGVDPSRLRLEVTETAVLRDEDAARGTLRRLRAAGIAVDLDDFGTGLSSLTRLRTLPIDAVKLDCAFTGELGPDGDGALVEGVVALARGLGIEVVAEGVEAADHVTRLVAVGCTAAQGRHLGAPMPARRVAAWLAGARRTAPAAAAIA